MTGADGNLGTALQEIEAAVFVPVGRNDWHRLPDLLAGVDAVLHLAWDLKTPATLKPAAVFDANLMTTTRLLEACRAQGVAKFALVSTCAVYGDGRDNSETAPCCPVTVNGITKLLNERVVEDFCAASGIECQIYRVFNMYGGRDQFSILSHLRRALDRGSAFTLNNGGVAQRDFIHVEDVARVVLALLGKSLPSVHVNIGTGQATRIADIVAFVQAEHPELRISQGSAPEAAYSCANTDRLRSILGELQFIHVMDYVRSVFGGTGQGQGH